VAKDQANVLAVKAVEQLTDKELSALVDVAVRRRNNAPTPAAAQAAREDINRLRDEMTRRLAAQIGI
jgi:hypothetical protein